MLKPSASRAAVSPDLLRESVTTCDPGASDDLTQGLRVRPSARAFRATRPAAISTDGLEVLVQLVIAVMTTSPWPRSKLSPVTATRLPAFAPFLSPFASSALTPSSEERCVGEECVRKCRAR